MIRKLFIGTWVLSTIALGAQSSLALGPMVEARFFPVKINQSLLEVTRREGKLCYFWDATKVRPLASYRNEASLEAAGGPFDMEVYEGDTGIPWTQTRPVPLGHQHSPLCVTLPPSVHDGDPVVLHQTAWYPGFWGLWALPVVMPDISSPG